LATLTVNSAGAAPITITGGGVLLKTINAAGVGGTTAFTATAANTLPAGFSLTTGAGADALTGFTGADTLSGGGGADTLTGGVGADSLTGGDGADTFVYGQNTALAVVSSLSAPDVIADFVSGTDKLQILNNVLGTGTAPTAFIGNFASVASAQAAAAQDGRGNLAYYVTTDKQLYVVAAVNGVAVATDTVISLPNTATLAIGGGDLQLGSQGSNAVAIAITAPGVLSTTANAGASAPTTNTDDTITQASTVAVGTGVATASAINGGLGADTYNLTIPAVGNLSSLSTSAGNTTSVALTSVETVNVTATVGGTVNLGAGGVPAGVQTLTISATDLNGALTASTTAAGQTFTVNNTATLGNTASTIGVANFANARVTTGNANDSITVAGGANSTGITVNTQAGADTVTLTLATALSNAGNTYNAGTNTTGTVDTLSLAYNLAAGSTVDLAALITAGTIAGFEALTIANPADGTTTITAGTGFTGYDLVLANDGADTVVVNATAAQANAITSLVFGATATSRLTITDGGTVSFASDVLTAVDLVNFGSAADMALTTGNQVLTVTQTGTGAAVTGFVIGSASTLTGTDITAANAAQTLTAVSTGAVSFSLPLNTLQNISALATAGGNAAYDAGDIILVSAAAATTTLTITGGTATTATAVGGATQTFVANLADADLVTTGANLDFINLGGLTAATTIGFGAGTSTTLLPAGTNATTLAAGPVVQIASTGATNISLTLITDSGNAGTRPLVVSGFTAGSGTGADVINLGGTIVSQAGIATTGAAATEGAAGAHTDLLILTSAATQISGSLTGTGNAGEVEARIIAAGITLAAQNANSGFYAVLDNGTDSGIYRVTLNATAGTANIIDNAGDMSVVLVGVILGVSNAGDFAAGNFV